MLGLVIHNHDISGSSHQTRKIDALLVNSSCSCFVAILLFYWKTKPKNSHKFFNINLLIFYASHICNTYSHFAITQEWMFKMWLHHVICIEYKSVPDNAEVRPPYHMVILICYFKGLPHVRTAYLFFNSKKNFFHILINRFRLLVLLYLDI